MRVPALVIGLLAAAAAAASPCAARAQEPAAVPVTIELSSLPFRASVTAGGQPLDRVAVSGVTVYDPVELVTFALGASSAGAGATTPQAVAGVIDELYREDGYFLAVTTVGDPQPDGTAALRVNEGRIAEVEIEGLSGKVSELVARYLRYVRDGGPVRQSAFERALMLSNDLAGVTLRSEFAVDGTSGDATLRLVGDDSRGAGSISFDTVPLAPGTSYRTYVVQEWRSPVFGGDVLRVMGLGARETGDATSALATIYYRTPVGSRGTYLEIRGGNAYAQRDFRQQALSSHVYGGDGAIGVGHPLRRNVSEYLYLITEYEFLGAESQFGTDAIRKSQSHSGRLTLVYGVTAGNGALTQVSATITGGMTPGGDKRLPGDPASFAHVRANIGTVMPVPFLGSRTFQRVEVFAQPFATRLPFVEHLFLGYGPYLRGYPPVEYSGERGVIGTAELSEVLVARNSGVFELVPSFFVDFGYADSHEARAPYAEAAMGLASTGLALEVRMPRLTLAGWLAVPLADGTVTQSGQTRAGVRVTTGW